MFKQPIPLVAGDVVSRDGFVYADLVFSGSLSRFDGSLPLFSGSLSRLVESK